MGFFSGSIMRNISILLLLHAVNYYGSSIIFTNGKEQGNNKLGTVFLRDEKLKWLMTSCLCHVSSQNGLSLLSVTRGTSPFQVNIDIEYQKPASVLRVCWHSHTSLNLAWGDTITFNAAWRWERMLILSRVYFLRRFSLSQKGWYVNLATIRSSALNPPAYCVLHVVTTLVVSLLPFVFSTLESKQYFSDMIDSTVWFYVCLRCLQVFQYTHIVSNNDWLATDQLFSVKHALKTILKLRRQRAPIFSDQIISMIIDFAE